MTRDKLFDSRLRAYIVSVENVEATVLVFACSHNEAKSLARGTEWFCDEPYTSLRAKRSSVADKYVESFGRGCLEAADRREQLVLRELGWYELEGSQTECSRCKLYPWSKVTESTLEYVGEELVCGECKERITKGLQ